ncbi:RND family efflux transporter, MFP subunit [Elysia marginata]|uniref:RND family efflux transporter, MFP subunit n=1 Tax=Elysia marginata TaxID=1093978 RepID=A0AAV4F230_9GAST|nr:RND family efflux transporter, MFP subunit [Elysia marginata]
MVVSRGFGICNLPVIPVRSAPTDRSEMTDQLLYGLAMQSPTPLTLDEALSLALTQNLEKINADRDIAISRKRVWESIAMGLPNISSSATYQDYMERPVTIVPATFMGGRPGEFAEVVFGTDQSVASSIKVHQIILDGSYIMGISSARLYNSISELEKEKKESDIISKTVMAYTNVLFAMEQVKILKNNVGILKKNVAHTESMFENGLVEEEALEQLNLTLLSQKGDVKTNQNIVLTAQYPGILTEVYCDEGQHVKKGSILAKIDDGGLGSGIEQVKIELNLAETSYKRQKRLWDKSIGSEIDFLKSKSTYESLQNRYKQVQEQYEKTIIKAPFSGIIDDKITPKGSSLSPGTPVFRIVNLSNMHTEIDVPEKYLTQIKRGMKVEVSIPVIGKIIKSSIRQVGNYINPNNRTFQVEVPIMNREGDVKPNLTAKVKIVDYFKEDAIVIPENLIQVNGDNNKFVYVVNSVSDGHGIVEKVFISNGKHHSGLVEVVSGLHEGKLLILEGAKLVKPGQKVKLLYSE